MFKTPRELCPLPQNAREDKKVLHGCFAKFTMIRVRLKDTKARTSGQLGERAMDLPLFLLSIPS